MVLPVLLCLLRKMLGTSVAKLTVNIDRSTMDCRIKSEGGFRGKLCRYILADPGITGQ